MEEDKSFFAQLFKLKHSKDLKDEKQSDENKKDKCNKRQVENEWLQEYELIYRSYTIDSY